MRTRHGIADGRKVRLTFAECGGGEIVVAVGWHFWVMEGLEGRGTRWWWTGKKMGRVKAFIYNSTSGTRCVWILRSVQQELPTAMSRVGGQYLQWNFASTRKLIATPRSGSQAVLPRTLFFFFLFLMLGPKNGPLERTRKEGGWVSTISGTPTLGCSTKEKMWVPFGLSDQGEKAKSRLALCRNCAVSSPRRYPCQLRGYFGSLLTARSS